MNEDVKKVLGRQEVLMMGPILSPVTGHRFPVYTAAKKIYTYPDTLHVLGRELGKLVLDADGRKVVGGETVGIILATAISMETGLPMCYVRKDVPARSARFGVEGIIASGENVVLVDDSLVSGATKQKFISNIESAGGVVTDIVAIIDVPTVAGDEYRKALSAKGIKVHTLGSWEDWFTALYEQGHLSAALLEVALDAARNIDSWREGAPGSEEKWKWFEGIRAKQGGKFI